MRGYIVVLPIFPLHLVLAVIHQLQHFLQTLILLFTALNSPHGLLSHRLVQMRRRLQQAIHHILVVRVQQWRDVLLLITRRNAHFANRHDRIDGCRLAPRLRSTGRHHRVFIIVHREHGVEAPAEMSELVAGLLPMFHMQI